MPDTPTMTEERLKEIEQRVNRATPGPWSTKPSGQNYEGFSLDVSIAATAPGKFNRVYATPPGGRFPAADQDFIAAARTDVPNLIAALRAEWEKVKALREACSSAMGMIDDLSPNIVEPEYTNAIQDVLAGALNRSRP